MVDPMSMETLVELVNGWGTDPRREDGRADEPHRPAAQIADRLGVPAEVRDRLTEPALAEIADRLHPVFATTDVASRARLVTGFLEETGVRPVLDVEAGRAHPGWRAAEVTVLASAAVALREYLGHHDSARLGMCSDRRCADVYVDTSPAGRRRFCSVTCQNRTRVAAFRHRRAAEGGSP